MNIPSNILTLIAGIALTAISIWFGQNHGLLPVAATKEASDVDGLFNLMMTIATGLFLLVEGVLVYSVIKFRRRKGDQTDGPAVEGNVPLEILWTAIPTVIVFILAIYSFEVYNTMGGLDPMVSHDMAPYKTAHHHGGKPTAMLALNSNDPHIALGIGKSPENPEQETPLTVDVNGIQYAWIFSYPESGVTAGELHVPVNQAVKLNLKAQDVIHAFWVPEFRLKQDAIPGRDTELIFTATKIGEYPIICAELCGAYHGGMKSKIYVQSEEDYNQWLQENTIAQAESQELAVAVNTVNLKEDEYLAPYAEEMGITSETIEHLQALHHNHSSI